MNSTILFNIESLSHSKANRSSMHNIVDHQNDDSQSSLDFKDYQQKLERQVGQQEKKELTSIAKTGEPLSMEPILDGIDVVDIFDKEDIATLESIVKQYQLDMPNIENIDNIDNIEQLLIQLEQAIPNLSHGQLKKITQILSQHENVALLKNESLSSITLQNQLSSLQNKIEKRMIDLNMNGASEQKMVIIPTNPKYSSRENIANLSSQHHVNDMNMPKAYQNLVQSIMPVIKKMEVMNSGFTQSNLLTNNPLSSSIYIPTVHQVESQTLKTALNVNSTTAEIGKQITQILGDKINIDKGRQSQQVSFRLDPPELGKLEIAIKVSDNKIHIQIGSNNPQVRDALHSVSDRLKDAIVNDSAMQSVDVNVQKEHEHVAQQYTIDDVYDDIDMYKENHEMVDMVTYLDIYELARA